MMSMDEPFRCNICKGMESSSREELDKHSRDSSATLVILIPNNAQEDQIEIYNDNISSE